MQVRSRHRDLDRNIYIYIKQAFRCTNLSLGALWSHSGRLQEDEMIWCWSLRSILLAKSNHLHVEQGLFKLSSYWKWVKKKKQQQPYFEGSLKSIKIIFHPYFYTQLCYPFFFVFLFHETICCLLIWKRFAVTFLYWLKKTNFFFLVEDKLTEWAMVIHTWFKPVLRTMSFQLSMER